VSDDALELLAAQPLPERIRAARKVIRSSTGLDADGRRAVLFIAIWPEGPPDLGALADDPATAATACRGCGADLPGDDLRRRYCTRACRLRTWRRERRAIRAALG
jgi:hypothetical protein